MHPSRPAPANQATDATNTAETTDLIKATDLTKAAETTEVSEPAERSRAPIPPDLRLVPATITGWTTVWWATGHSPESSLWLALLTTCVTLAALVLLLRSMPATTREPNDDAVQSRTEVGLNRWRHWVLPLCASVAVAGALVTLLATATAARQHRRETDPLAHWAQSGLSVTVAGRLSSDPMPIRSSFPGARQRYLARLTLVSATAGPSGGNAIRHGAGTVTLVGSNLDGLAAGQQVRVRGRLSPSGRGEPEVVVLTSRSRPEISSPGGWIWQAANRLREGLRRACGGLSPDAGGLLPALVVGDTSRVPPDLVTDLRDAGLTHLTAVSGTNVAILASAVAGAVALAGARIWVRVGVSVLVIAGFVVVARPEPSVLRAAVMAALALVALASSRPGRGIPLLCGAVVILLLVDPWLSRSYGFALSVLATAGLLILVPAWLRRLRSGPGLLRGLAIVIAVPVAALLSTAPVTVLLQPRLSAVSVPANLFAEPAVALATLSGVVAAALSPWWSWGAELAAHVGGFGTGWIAAVAHRAAHVPGGQVDWLPGEAGAALLAMLLLAVTVLSLRPGQISAVAYRRPEPLRDRLIRSANERIPRDWRVPAAVLGVVVLVSGVLAGRAGVLQVPDRLRGGQVPRDWLVVQCDVGQGSATLINTGGGRGMMVDTGPEPSAARKCLRQAHIRVLDILVITHFHADHAGGLDGVLPRAGAPPLLVSPFAAPTDQVRKVRAVARSAGSDVVEGHAGMGGVIGTGAGAVNWTVLAPDVNTAARLHVQRPTDDGTEIMTRASRWC